MMTTLFKLARRVLDTLAKLSLTATILLSVFEVGSSAAWGQRQVTEALAQDEIGVIKTGPGFCTRISFPDDVAEVFCGDLYDPATGKGNFVLQSSGKDIFLKPIATSGISNLFVKVGKGRSQVYNFELRIVPALEANLIVRVIEASNDATVTQPERKRVAPMPPRLPTIGPLLVDGISNSRMMTRIPLDILGIPERALPPDPPLPSRDSSARGSPVAASSAKSQ